MNFLVHTSSTKGKAKLQYHTHILIPEFKYPISEAEEAFNTSLRERCKCISRWRNIDTTEVNSSIGVMGYANKEPSSQQKVFDFLNSIPIIPNK